MCTSGQPRQRGVTLIEMIFFMVIIGVALAGLVTVFNMSARDSADPMRRKQALMLAEAMMEEVQLAGFTYCDPTDANATTAISTAGCASIPEAFGQVAPEPVATQRPFDNINDYVSAANTWQQPFGPVDALLDTNGATLPLQGYTVELKIVPVVLQTYGTAGASADSDTLHIQVRVSYDGSALILDGYRMRYAPRFQ